MNIIEIFSKNLKKYRIKKNLSQEKLAELCSFNRTYISSLERGIRTPYFINYILWRNLNGTKI